MSSVDIETVLQQAKTDALYIRDSLTSAFEDRCTFGDCKDLHFSACHSEFLDAECIGESPLLGRCIDVSCQEVRDYTYAAGEKGNLTQELKMITANILFAIFLFMAWVMSTTP